MDLVFCGTPQFAVPTLEKLVEAGHRVVILGATSNAWRMPCAANSRLAFDEMNPNRTVKIFTISGH